MKKKLLKSLRVLLVAAGLCVGASAWGDPIETIGTTSAEWWTAFSETYTLEGYGSYNFKFTTTNANDGTSHNTWLLIATNGNDSHGSGGTEYFAYRGDSYAWGQSTNSNESDKLNCSNTYSGSNLQAAMNGASVDLTVTRKSTNISLVATVTPTNGDSEFTMSFEYLFGNATSDNIGLFLTVEKAQVVLNTAEQTESYTTVWTTEFSSAPSGMTYSVTNGSVTIEPGYLVLRQSGNGSRAMNIAFTDNAFNVDTDWIMEFDWNCGRSNSEQSSAIFATNSGTAFSMSWGKLNNDLYATIKDASDNNLTTTLPTAGYNVGTTTSWNHFVVKGVKDDGIYLTVTNGNATYVNNVKVSSTFSYPKTFNGTLAKAVSTMFLDNILFMTPTVAGFVAVPSGTITKAVGTSRKFTLSCFTDGVTIYYSETEREIGADGWTTYSTEVTTSAATIYTYASDGVNNSERGSFATGAGTTVSLSTPTISATGFSNTTGISVTNPTFNFVVNNSEVLGKPAATLSYTFTPEGGSESVATVGTSYTPTEYGTLKVIASADGYDSSEKTLTVSSLYTVYYTGRDYSTATTSDAFATFGADASVTWDGWASGLTSNLITAAVSDDQHLNIQNENTINFVSGWGLVRNDKTYGYRVRYAKEGDFIALKYNTSKGSDASANSYNTVYCATGTGAQGNLVTITIAVAGAVQQLYHYSPSRTSVSKSISAAGWATYCSPYALDLENATNLTDAYIVTGGAGGVLTKTSVKGGTVPANTGLLLKGTEGSAVEVTIPVVASSSTDVSANKLTGVTANTEIAAEAGYVLMNDETNGLGFYLNTYAFTVGANTAYLPEGFDDSGARIAFFSFGDETTGIQTVNGEGFTVNGYYNLNGQRVNQPSKGLFIVNGKKVIVK